MGIKQQFEGVRAREASILIDFRWNKERFRERVELAPTTPNMRAAARMRDEIRALVDLGRFTWKDFTRYVPGSPSIPDLGGKAAGPLFGDVADDWMTLTAQGVAATTLQEYENALNRYWQPPFGTRPIEGIEYEEVALYVAALPIKSPKTFNNIMTPARGIFAYAFKTKKVPHDIMQEIDSRRGQKTPPDPLESDEMELVLDHIQRKYHPQWHNYFETAFFSGLRPSEQIALQWPKVDFRLQQTRIDTARVRTLDKDTKTHSVRDIDLQTRAERHQKAKGTQLSGRRPRIPESCYRGAVYRHRGADGCRVAAYAEGFGHTPPGC
jgi:integrase